jgi:hypothetical protein
MRCDEARGERCSGGCRAHLQKVTTRGGRYHRLSQGMSPEASVSGQVG